MSAHRSPLTRITDPIRRRIEARRITVLEASTIAAASLKGRWGSDVDALIVAYPATARACCHDVPAAKRRLTAFLATA